MLGKSLNLNNLNEYDIGLREQIKNTFSTKNELSNMENDIETNVTNSLKTEFFSKQETIDYINNKFDTKVDKVDGFGLSANNFSDNYKNMLDDLDLADRWHSKSGNAKSIDYAKTMELLDIRKKESLSFLENSLKGVESQING